MAGTLEGRVAVVTGAGRGVGRGIALALAQEGAAVVVNDTGGATDGTGLDKGPADSVVKEISAQGGRAAANYDSVASFEAAGRIVQTALDRFGRLDILVNNAGISRRAPFWELTEEAWDAVITVHLKGTFNCIRHACGPMMAQRCGRIVNVFSVSAFGYAAGHPPYAAAKGGIWGLTNEISQEFAPYGITVNAVSPGLTDTRLAAHRLKARQDNHPATWQPVKERPATRLGVVQPEDVAPFIAFLCTTDAGAINGQTFLAYGPYIAWYPVPEPASTLFKEGRWTVEELARYVRAVMPHLMKSPPATP